MSTTAEAPKRLLSFRCTKTPVGWAAAGAAVGTIGSAYMQGEAARDAARTQGQGADAASQVTRDMFDITRFQQQPFIQSGYGANDVLSRLMGLAPSPRGGAGGTGGMITTPGTINQSAPGMPDWQQYLLDNPDVAADAYFGTRPELHYQRHGRGEGRAMPTIQAPTTAPGGGEFDEQGYAQDNTGLSTGFLTQLFGPEQFKAGMDPGYQWRLQQGAQGVMNTAAAGSGALSGPALRALMEYNQGAASQEFGNAFNRFQTQQGNIFQRLTSMAGLGQNAAANVGNNAMTAGGQIGSNIVGAANAGAAGQIGVANAYGGALSDLGATGAWAWMNRPKTPTAETTG
jgi:hypothetical protein